MVGVDDGEGTPVPIPNTEVKLICVEDTWLATAWENRLMPTLSRRFNSNLLFYFSKHLDAIRVRLPFIRIRKLVLMIHKMLEKERFG